MDKYKRHQIKMSKQLRREGDDCGGEISEIEAKELIRNKKTYFPSSAIKYKAALKNKRKKSVWGYKYV